MKHCIYFTFAAILFIAGCDSKNNASGTGENKQPETPKRSPLEEEALSKIRETFEEYWLKEDDSYFAQYLPDLAVDELRGVTRQVKGVTYKLSDTELTEADRLNGLQWKGILEFSAKASRSYNPKQTQDSKVGWGEWRSGNGLIGYFQLTKREGIWTAAWKFQFYIKPTLQNLPPL